MDVTFFRLAAASNWAESVSVNALRDLLKAFIDAGYTFRGFTDELQNSSVILRHDVDFSLDAALAAAELENDLGVSATFFFLLSSDFYNLLSTDNRRKIQKINDLGHTISLHYDPTAHADIDAGFVLEYQTFCSFFGTRPSIISLHRPQGFLEDNNRRLPHVHHTYEDRFFRDIKYISDSRGNFRHGHPLESDEFRNRLPIHLLLHPIWWVSEGETPSDRIRTWQREHYMYLNSQISRNCDAFDGRCTSLAEE